MLLIGLDDSGRLQELIGGTNDQGVPEQWPGEANPAEVVTVSVALEVVAYILYSVAGSGNTMNAVVAVEDMAVALAGQRRGSSPAQTTAPFRALRDVNALWQVRPGRIVDDASGGSPVKRTRQPSGRSVSRVSRIRGATVWS
jgi:hypothetical protein